MRDLKAVSLEDAVHKMTGKPAAVQSPRAGLCREGYAADLVLFDAATIADRATWDDPLAPPVGVSRVMVNGEWVVVDNEPTGICPVRCCEGRTGFQPHERTCARLSSV
ncbi:MAG: amidohydrolase family protein [Thermomicrobiales bacterium]